MIPPVAKGYERKWWCCETCEAVFYQDFVPYSLSNPITWLPCGHGVGKRIHEAARSISETDAMDRMARRSVEAA